MTVPLFLQIVISSLGTGRTFETEVGLSVQYTLLSPVEPLNEASTCSQSAATVHRFLAVSVSWASQLSCQKLPETGGQS